MISNKFKNDFYKELNFMKSINEIEDDFDVDGLGVICEVNVTFDRYGIVRGIAAETGVWDISEFMERLDDVLDYYTIMESGGLECHHLEDSVLILLDYNMDIEIDGCVSVICQLPQSDYPSDPIQIRLPSEDISGREIRRWRRDCENDGIRSDNDRISSLIIKSAQWMLSKICRSEPLVFIGVAHRDIEVDPDYDATKESENSNESHKLVRLTISPNFLSEKTTNLEWPKIEIDLIIQMDGFVSNKHQHFGMWVNSESSSGAGLAVLGTDGVLNITGLAREPITLPTNLLSRQISKISGCCLWKQNWTKWMRYDVVDRKEII